MLALNYQKEGALMSKKENSLDINQDFITFSQVKEEGVPYSVIRRSSILVSLKKLVEVSIESLMSMLMSHIHCSIAILRVYIHLKQRSGYMVCH